MAVSRWLLDHSRCLGRSGYSLPKPLLTVSPSAAANRAKNGLRLDLGHFPRTGCIAPRGASFGGFGSIRGPDLSQGLQGARAFRPPRKKRAAPSRRLGTLPQPFFTYIFISPWKRRVRNSPRRLDAPSLLRLAAFLAFTGPKGYQE